MSLRPLYPTLLVLMLGAACSERKIIRIADGSTAARLVFEFENAGQIFGDDAVQVRGFKVDRCGDRSVVWEMMGNTPRGVPVESLQYGAVPTGWEETAPSQPLTTGCYTVQISGSEPVGFHVESNGQVRELTDAELREERR